MILIFLIGLQLGVLVGAVSVSATFAESSLPKSARNSSGCRRSSIPSRRPSTWLCFPTTPS